MRFELDYCSLVVIETKVARSVTPKILGDNCVPSDRSQDLMEAVVDVPAATPNGGL